MRSTIFAAVLALTMLACEHAQAVDYSRPIRAKGQRCCEIVLIERIPGTPIAVVAIRQYGPIGWMLAVYAESGKCTQTDGHVAPQYMLLLENVKP